jgi:hypothetical protein
VLRKRGSHDVEAVADCVSDLLASVTHRLRKTAEAPTDTVDQALADAINEAVTPASVPVRVSSTAGDGHCRDEDPEAVDALTEPFGPVRKAFATRTGQRCDSEDAEEDDETDGDSRDYRRPY